jgi:pimeloyl-ACP methyl ester carboxylesterase
MNVLANGARHEVLRVGGGGVPIVLLHEGLGSAAHWKDFPTKLAERTRSEVVAYSRLGYGASDPVPLPRPLDYMEQDARTSVPAVLDALGLERVVLFGHSDGASISLVHAALDARSRVRALVLEAPHVFVEDVSVASIARAREAYEQGDLRARLGRYHGANVDVAFRGWNDAWLDPRFRAWNLEAYLPDVRVPVLVIQGEDDPYGTRAQVDAIARQVAGPVAVELLPRCGHAPHRDAPEIVLERVARFVVSL